MFVGKKWVGYEIFCCLYFGVRGHWLFVDNWTRNTTRDGYFRKPRIIEARGLRLENSRPLFVDFGSARIRVSGLRRGGIFTDVFPVSVRRGRVDGAMVTIDGETGSISLGLQPLKDGEPTVKWASRIDPVEVINIVLMNCLRRGDIGCDSIIVISGNEANNYLDLHRLFQGYRIGKIGAGISIVADYVIGVRDGVDLHRLDKAENGIFVVDGGRTSSRLFWVKWGSEPEEQEIDRFEGAIEAECEIFNLLQQSSASPRISEMTLEKKQYFNGKVWRDCDVQIRAAIPSWASRIQEKISKHVSNNDEIIFSGGMGAELSKFMRRSGHAKVIDCHPNGLVRGAVKCWQNAAE